jgi:hypothetical protein
MGTFEKWRAGSPCVSEIELNRVLMNEWPNVLKWLNNLDLLRVAGLEAVTLRA